MTLRTAYESGSEPWFLGFSGGKDSSALLRLVYEAVARSSNRLRPVTVIYCDTRVENPIIAGHVRQTLRGLRKEATSDGLPIRVVCARPSLQDGFFVKVIGRGYPPPTNKFRWCTDRLRIDPVGRVIAEAKAKRAWVLLGTRRGESIQRDQILSKQTLSGEHFFKQSGNPSITIFAPIVNFTVTDVWAALMTLARPLSLDSHRLARLYKDSGAECPIFREGHGTPCGAGRFGCWTCTVVRKDRSSSSMITEGHEELRPLKEFRDWLARMRDEPANRCRVRRNGQPGSGPLTLKARRMILRRLMKAQTSSPWKLIDSAELTEIRRLWREDRGSLTYRE